LTNFDDGQRVDSRIDGARARAVPNAGEIGAISVAVSHSQWRRFYVLGLFTIIYTLNFIDRQIITILAPYLKADLLLTDAQIGLLFGTAFALFYALFGLPLARLADGWNRVATLCLGLGFWSAMTAASGFATSFVHLAGARVGVGVGEASASPAAISILQDYFPRRARATVLAIYQSGVYLGAGASLMLGGAVIAWWTDRFGTAPPLGLAGWQAAYLIVGLPGIFLALLTWATVREPVRGAIDGTPQPNDPHPFRAACGVFATLLPPTSLIIIGRGGGRGAGLRNAAVLACSIMAAIVLIQLTDGVLSENKRVPIATLFGTAITTNVVQWSAIALGTYATVSWATALRLRDPAAARLVIQTPSVVALALGSGLISLSSYGLSAFVFVYAIRYLGAGPEAGLSIGGVFAVAGGLGTMIGGALADAARARHPAGRLYLASAAVGGATVTALFQYSTNDWTVFLIFHAITSFLLTMWLGAVYASSQDQVLPRMRGLAVAVQFLATSLIGLGLGPYWVGLVSDATGDLRLAMLSVLAPGPVVIFLFLYAARHLSEAERTAVARAEAAIA
jgi:MFS family permease